MGHRRDKPQAAARDCQVALRDAELARHVLSQYRQTSGRLAWSVALIDQPPVIKKILAHLGLATEALIEPEDPFWRVRGPSEVFPPDLDDAGLALELDDAGLALELDAVTRTPANRSLTSCRHTTGRRSWAA